MRHFKLREFDSPDAPGSGRMMDRGFLRLLDEARDCAGIPFVISSGFRTVDYNRSLIAKGLPASRNSSHLLGLAADIEVLNSQDRFIIIDALMEVGITRIGIGKNFIHCDIDEMKPENRIWTYA